jgi:hypothetical protein
LKEHGVAAGRRRPARTRREASEPFIAAGHLDRHDAGAIGEDRERLSIAEDLAEGARRIIDLRVNGQNGA